MKRQIRTGVFESNSSATHTLTICSEETYKKWENGELLLTWDNKFIPNKEMSEEEKDRICHQWYDEHKCKYYKDYKDLTKKEKKEIEDDLKSKGYFNVSGKTYDEWYADDYLGYLEDSFITEHGDKVVAFSKAGNDY